MKKILFLVVAFFLIFASMGNTATIRMDELTDGTSSPPTTSWYVVGYNGTVAYRFTIGSLLGLFTYPAAGVAVSTGTGWTTSLNITGISNSTSTTSSTVAASATAVKSAYDLANGKQDSNAALTSLAGLTETNGGIPYGTGTNAYAWLAAGAAGKVLQGNGAAAPVWSTPTYPSASGTARKILVSDGTNNVYSTETWAVPGTSGNILKSDGTNWTSSNTLSSVTIGGFTPSKVLCSDGSGNALACTNLTDTAFSAYATLASPTFTGTVTLPASTSLTTPVIGAATGTSLYATGRLDGTVGMVLSTATSATTISSTNNKSSYYMNRGDSDAHSIYTLPTAAAGLQYCVKNYTGITTVLTFQTSASGQYIDLDGTNTASGGFIHSAGAAGDGACVVGVDSTHWVAIPIKGTWSRD
jgi:hypothetical protein